MRKLWSSGSARFRVSFFCAPFCASVLPGPSFRRLRIFLFSAPPLPGCLLPCCFSSELLFFLPSCSFFFRAAVFLLRCPVPCCLFPLPSFLASFPVRPLPARPLPARPLPARPLSSRPLPRVPSFPHAFFSRLLSRALSFRALFPARPLPRVPSFPCALFPRSLSRAPSSPRTLFPARLFFAPPFPCALFPARLFPRASFCTPSFRASRTFLPRLHSSRLEPSPQLEHSPTGTSAERNGSGWNGSKWGSNVCAIVFGASTGPSRAVYVTKLLNIFRILLKYLHNSKQPRIFAVKF